MSCQKVLKEHEKLSERREKSLVLLEKVQTQFSECDYFKDLPITIFCAGSLARMEIGEKSDLDLFVTADEDAKLHSRLAEYTLFANMIKLNEALDFPAFSNDGEYLKVYFLEELKNRTGSRHDDIENMFTARMLLMLESKPLIKQEIYEEHLKQILEHYYRDEKGKKSFRPLFLLNDLLRYWRTLCLNYEERRHDPEKPWRKKNINLKFSRMMTVFSTVLPLIAKPINNTEDLKNLCEKTALERLATGLEIIENEKLNNEWPKMLDIYESFLSWKEDDNIEKSLRKDENKAKVDEYAACFSNFFYEALNDEKIPIEFRRYLVL